MEGEIPTPRHPQGATWQPTLDRDELVKEAKLAALRSVAEAMGIDPFKVKIETQKEMGHDLSCDVEVQLFETQMKKLREEADPQTLVWEQELQADLHDGSMFVAVLPSGKIVLRK